jgi:hypothetical protein
MEQSPDPEIGLESLREPLEIPLKRPPTFAKATAGRSGTFSPTGGEGWDEEVRFTQGFRLPMKIFALNTCFIALLVLNTFGDSAEALPVNSGEPLIEKVPAAKGKPTVSDEDREFWAFRPLLRESPPAVKNPAWCRSPIDRFVLAKLESKNLSPRPRSERRKLIRRVYFDLIGLPPTPEEVQAFLNDTGTDAYEKLLDHLLASPHYGERWGRHWLDLARFAESHGFEHDTDRPTAYHYRDFVIQALNRDLPYDRFVKLQIAGDELEPDNTLALMATGFLAAGVHATQITANQAEKERYDELDDMVSTVGTSMLGLTIGCARCHDHKFDAIPQSDYYRLLSTFTATVRSEAQLDFRPEQYQQAKVAFERQHAPLVEALQRFEQQDLPARLEQWLNSDPKPPQPKWLVLKLDSAKSQGGALFTALEDGSYLAGGKNPKADTYTFVARTPFTNITAVRIEALSHASFLKNGPGRAANGNFALSDFRLSVAPLNGATSSAAVKLVRPKATFEQKGLAIAAAVDDDPKSGWAIDPQFGKDHAAVFELESPAGHEGGMLLTFTLKFETNDGHSIGRPRLAISTSPTPATLDGDQAPQDLIVEARQILAVASERRTDEQRSKLLKWYRTIDADWQKLDQAVRDHLAKSPKPELTKVLISSEGLPPVRLNSQGPDFYEKTYFLKRGDLSQKQDEAAPGFLQVLMRAPDRENHWQAEPPKGSRTSFRRTALANWITDTDRGAGSLLARVIVNRLWQHHFGRGPVATPNDFGRQGGRPTHPELLDWLANELIQQGWSLKSLHKAIMTSAAYTQGSEYDEPSATADPDNTWLWRQSPRRVDGEVVRDAMLAVSGVLDERMFGPGTLDEAQRRRSIYFTIKRSKLIPMMSMFDAPDGLQSLGQRQTTTVAPQALLLLNNPQVRAWSREFARRLVARAGAARAEVVRAGYWTALGRPPSEDELADTLRFLETQIRSYSEADGLERAVADFCQTLMGLNEFVYVE